MRQLPTYAVPNYALHMLAKMNRHSQAETNRKNERRRIDGRKNKQTE